VFWFGHSMMIDGSLPDAAWWAEWAARSFAGWLLVVMGFGIGMFTLGFWLLVSGMKRIR
jgi:hypothetical protein